MARSFKKTPGWCDRSPWWKRYANKRIRQLHRRGGEISDGGRYKRHTCSWHICDARYLYWSERRIRETTVGYWYGDEWWESDTPRYKLFTK
jgi:hypothetical protein